MYIASACLSLGFIIYSYFYLDIKKIEPQKYIADLAIFEFDDSIDATTPYNTYHPHFNSFGSRNLFEVSNLINDIVILLGDSFFFGYGLNDNETISFFLKKFDKKRKYINFQ